MNLIDFLTNLNPFNVFMGKQQTAAGFARLGQILLGILILLIGIALVIAASKGTRTVIELAKNVVPAGKAANVVESVAA